MKKLFLFFLLACVLTPAVYAGNAQRYSQNEKISNYLYTLLKPRLEARAEQEHYSQMAEEQLVQDLQNWAASGNTEELAQLAKQAEQFRSNAKTVCGDNRVLLKKIMAAGEVSVCINPSVLRTKDHFGNNLFHKAKNVQTVAAIGYVARNFYPADFSMISEMKNEKNTAQETPLVSHISRGDLASFFPLYDNSKLAQSIAGMEAIGFKNTGIAWQSSADIYKQEIAQWGTNAAGVNVAQLVQMQPQTEQQIKLMRFFRNHAPYLLN